MEEKDKEHKEEENEVVLDLDNEEEESSSTDSDTTATPTLVDEEELKKLEDKFLRLQAEFDNYRKRMDTRFSEYARYAAEGILLKVLEVYDNIERALVADFEADPVSAKKGIEGIQQQLSKILSKEEVKPIESLNQPFDPYYHNAINKTSDSSVDDGVIVEVYQRGYMLKDRVLRPAIVCVNRHASPAGEGPKENNNQETEER